MSTPSQKTRRAPLTTNLLLALTAAAATPLAASADTEFLYYVNEGIYGVRFSHMPDFDQRRFGLAGNGQSHCVPTATTNLFAYMANHGFPNVGPGPGYWAASSGPQYDIATATINNLGFFMGTTAANGTNGSGWQDGLETWLNPHAKFDIIHKWAGGSYSPTVGNMVEQAALGGIVAFAYGRYEIDGTDSQGRPILDRQGGHAVTLQYALASGLGQSLIRYRDPADDSNLSTQSPFQSREMFVFPTQVRLDWQPNTVLTMNQFFLNPPPADGRLRIIDEFIAIRPKAGYAFQPSTNTIFIQALDFAGIAPSNPFEISLDGIGSLITGVVNAEQDGVFVLVNDNIGPLEVWAMSPLNDEHTVVASLTRATQLAVSPRGNLYIANNTLLRCVDPLQPDADPIDVPTTIRPTDMAFNPQTHQLVILSSLSRAIAIFPSDLQGNPTTLSIPTPIPVATNSDFAISPTDGTYWIVTPTSNAAYGVTYIPGAAPVIQTVNLPANSNPTSIDVSEEGDLFIVTDQGLIQAIEARGAWSTQLTNEYGDIPADATFTISRSTSNFDPAIHSLPRYDHIPADEVLPVGITILDCPGDLDGSGLVDLTDLNLLLAAFNTSAGGDTNGDGATDLTDLNALLAQFGDSCP